MKKLIRNAVFAGVMAFAISVSAVVNPEIVLPGGEFPKDDIGNITQQNGLGDANVLLWLQNEASLNGFPEPTTNQSDYKDGDPIVAGDYIVMHYGGGGGGSLVILYFNADLPGGYDVPDQGDPFGPIGAGHDLSFARLYDHVPKPTPDSGTTLALLGMGLTGMSFLSRKFRK
jgi:hypothetical protein